MTVDHIAADRPRLQGGGLLRLIGCFKLLKGVALIFAAIATFRLMHKDLAEEIIRWARLLHIAPGNHFVADLIGKVLTVTKRQLIVLGVVLLIYSGMFLTEGVGLLLLQHWAEWMTVITTTGLIPFEIYEMIRRPTLLKSLAMVINIVIAVYLAIHVRRETRDANLGSLNPN
jgi:uncharacterized membrane protein (DUF2068 family)